MADAACAPLGRRLLSGLYELVVLAGLMLMSGFVMVPIGRAMALTGGHEQSYTRAWVLLVVSGYFLWFWTHGGQTLPMKTWRLRLLTVEGRPLMLDRALLRLVLALAGWGLLGAHFAWALFDRDGQFLHDRMVGTRIVRALPP